LKIGIAKAERKKEMKKRTKRTSNPEGRDFARLKISRCSTFNSSRCAAAGAEVGMKSERSCEDCEFCRPAKGKGVVVLTCDRKDPANRLIVKAGDFCDKFMRDRELVHIDIASALAEGAKLIPLSQRKFAIVDAEDYDRFSKYKWHASNKGQTSYAQRNGPDGIVCMHRLIAGAPPHLVVDHINHNGLDNRKKNLRLCTQAQNIYNSLPRRNCSSKYKGVYLHKRTNRYRATIRYKGKRFHLGSFKNEVDAAKAYDKKACELFGQFAYLNFPEDCSVGAIVVEGFGGGR